MWRLLVTHSILLFPLHFSFRASPCAITFQTQSTLKPSVCFCFFFFYVFSIFAFNRITINLCSSAKNTRVSNGANCPDLGLKREVSKYGGYWKDAVDRFCCIESLRQFSGGNGCVRHATSKRRISVLTWFRKYVCDHLEVSLRKSTGCWDGPFSV